MKLLTRGAEADIYVVTHDSHSAILKVRKSKPYINAQLDEKLRKTRTLREAQMITAVKEFGIAAPLILDLAPNRITMQRIRGTVVGSMRAGALIRACGEIGGMAARMHKNGIVHGDMTTSNFIASRGRLFVIDMGLSSWTARTEDYAVDLRLFKEILNSAHTQYAARAWKSFVAKYSRIIGKKRFVQISRAVADIEARGRYARVV